VSNWVEDTPTVQSYALNKVLFDLHHKPEHLQQFKADAKGYLSQSGLTPVAR
jgi:protocatechuate 4,5-dioxygenase alpha chain